MGLVAKAADLINFSLDYLNPEAKKPKDIVDRMVVIDARYCSPTPKDFVIKKIAINNYEIKDTKGKIVFIVTSEFPYFQGRKVFTDAANNPIISMSRKIPSAHNRWQVFKGNSQEPRDMIFSAKQPSMVQISTELDVYMASNKLEGKCDYKVKGSFIGRSCTIYKGDTDTIIAQMHENNSIESLVLGRDTFIVTVYPEVDYAFIVSIIIILGSIR